MNSHFVGSVFGGILWRPDWGAFSLRECLFTLARQLEELLFLVCFVLKLLACGSSDHTKGRGFCQAWKFTFSWISVGVWSESVLCWSEPFPSVRLHGVTTTWARCFWRVIICRAYLPEFVLSRSSWPEMFPLHFLKAHPFKGFWAICVTFFIALQCEVLGILVFILWDCHKPVLHFPISIRLYIVSLVRSQDLL